MKKIILLQIILLLLIQAKAQKFKPQWGDQIGGSGWDIVNGITMDNKDNVYLIGSFTGEMKHDKGNSKSFGDRDVYIGKYSKEGKLKWIKHFGGNGFDNGVDIIHDGKNHLYISGISHGTMKYERKEIKAGGRSAFLAKINENGNLKWMKVFEGKMINIGGLLFVERTGVYLSGHFKKQLSAEKFSLESKGGYDIFIAKVYHSGRIATIKQIGDACHNRISDIAADSDNNYYIAGTNFDCNQKSLLVPKVKPHHVFFSKYNNDWQQIWTKNITGNGFKEAVSIATSEDSLIYLCGHFEQNIEVNNRRLSAKGLEDVFIATYTSEGSFSWTKQIGGPLRDDISAISVMKDKRLVATGSFSHSIEADNISLRNYNKGKDIFIAFLGNTGELQSMQKLGDNETDYSKALVTDGEGNIYISGSFNRFMKIRNDRYLTHGSRDIFLARLFNCTNVAFRFSDSIVVCGDEPVEIPDLKGYKSVSWETASTNNLKVAGTEAYHVDAVDSLGCEITDTIFIQHIPLPEVNIGNDTTITQNDELMLSANNNFDNYRWNDNTNYSDKIVSGYKLTPGSYTYWIEVSDEYGCVNRDSIIVEILKGLDTGNTGLVVFPNPAKENIHWSLETEHKQIVSVEVTDIQGRLIYHKVINNYSPMSIKTIRIPNHKGLVTIRIKSGSVSRSRKVLLE